MYRKEYSGQAVLAEFSLPFYGKLDAGNRWVKLAKVMPWKKIEEYYLKSMSQKVGRDAFSARLAFGAIYVRQSEKLSDRAVVDYIQENPYVQYFLGLKEFCQTPLFDPSMMVHFRKRFPVEFVAQVNEYVCTGKWPEEHRNVDRNDDQNTGNDGSSNSGNTTDKADDNQEKPDTKKEEPDTKKEEAVKNSGTLIMDATVAPADIKYPTDIDLLNQCREHLEKAIHLLWPFVKHNCHEYPYRRKEARKYYLNVSKSKKWTKKKLRKGIEKQLRYVELGIKRLETMKADVSDWEKQLPKWLRERLETVSQVHEQQKKMFENGVNSVEHRIVSLHQPHVRPIVRGKRPNPTEFGQKLHLSVVNGYTFIEQTCWEAYNEATDLKATVEDYRRRYGYYPKAVLADKIYQNRENRKYCKDCGIRLSGPPLGRPKAGTEAEESKAQMYRDACDRNVVESRNGILKRRYGLDLIMSKLDETAKTEAAMDILAMNAWRRVRDILLHFFHVLTCRTCHGRFEAGIA